ncbi:MAG: hypothetical protein MR782_08340 [Campylobacter sp.]|nr:hypothetical protein [Campylobacter sp.]
MGFAVAAVKTRLQDFRAIFSFKAAALAVVGASQLQKFCAEFFASQSAGSRRKPQKNRAKVLQSDWAAQGFKAKKRHPADAKQKKLSQPIKANKKLGNFRIPCDEIPGQGGQTL